MSDIVYVTQEGLDKMKEELRYLKKVARPKISQAIADAREKGDLSENAEYDAAKDEQGHLELKISKMETLVGNARVLDESQIDTSKVTALSTVYLNNLKINKEVKYKLVSENEADLKSGKISVKSPIGSGLLGKVVGDVVEIQVPAGTVKFEILKIALD